MLESKDIHAALETYDKQLQIESKLHQLSPETRYARGVAVSYSHIGQMYDRLGDFPRFFQLGLAIAYAYNVSALSGVGQSLG